MPRKNIVESSGRAIRFARHPSGTCPNRSAEALPRPPRTMRSAARHGAGRRHRPLWRAGSPSLPAATAKAGKRMPRPRQAFHQASANHAGSLAPADDWSMEIRTQAQNQGRYERDCRGMSVVRLQTLACRRDHCQLFQIRRNRQKAVRVVQAEKARRSASPPAPSNVALLPS